MTRKAEPFPHDYAATIELFEKLSPHASFDIIPSGTRLYPFKDGISYCYLIRSGICGFHHSADEILISILRVPGIVGIGGIVDAEGGIFIQTQSEAEIATLTLSEARQLVSRLNLWELLSRHIFRATHRLFTLGTYLAAPSAYEVLRFQLIELMGEPAQFRERISASQYIQQKTHLSRSSIMKILAQLKQGGYVKLEDGVLKEIYHLPLKY